MPSHPAFLSCVLRLQIRDRNLCCRDAIAARAFRPAGKCRGLSEVLAFRRLQVSARDIKSGGCGYDNTRAHRKRTAVVRTPATGVRNAVAVNQAAASFRSAVSLNASGELAFVQNKLAFAQTPLLRIPSDVTNTVGQVARVANQPIEIVTLPKITFASKQRIDFARCKPLPTQNNLLQRPRWVEHESGVHVIRHHHPSDLRDSVSIKVTQSFCNNCRAMGTSQNTRTVTCIKPAFNRTRKTLVILTFRFGIPWWRMKSQPRLAIRLPLLAQVFRHGVGKPECNEINCSFLLPVRKPIRCKTNVVVWIKELKLGRFQGAAVS